MTENYIQTELAKYNLPDAAIAQMKEDYLPLKVSGVNDIDGYMQVKEAYKVVSKIRIDIEKKRKELKASSLEYGRAVDKEAARLTEGVMTVEDHLTAQRKIVEDEKQRIADEIACKEQEEKDRIAREEEARLEAIRVEQAEKERKIAEAQAKIEADRLANEQEKQRLADEKDRQEQEKIEAEQAKKRAEQSEKDRVEREKQHAKEVEEAKIEAIKQEKRRKEEEEKAKIEAARIAKIKEEHAKQMAPDKVKLFTLGITISEVRLPEVESPEAKGILLWAKEQLENIVEELKNAKL